MNNISIFGTNSDAGKSTMTFVLGKLLQNEGFSIAPFKAQNFSNNSNVCEDHYEIAIAQYFQSIVLNIEPERIMNPILCKSGSIIIKGTPVMDPESIEKYRNVDNLKPIVKKSFEELNHKYDIVIAEGVGSPVELNYIDLDLANIYVATEFNTKIILIADIEKCGVFASIYGVINLLPDNLKKNLIGVIINKYHGENKYFNKGRQIIEEEFHLPVFGVLPYIPFNFGVEDIASIHKYSNSGESNPIISIGVIQFPHISNFNDLEPLIADEQVNVHFIKYSSQLNNCDLIILPGSRRVIEDLKWMKENGIFNKILNIHNTNIYGICGGFEMLFNRLIDNDLVENSLPVIESGFGYINDDIVFFKDKILQRGKYNVFGIENVLGFEIRHGQSTTTYYNNDLIKGCFLHGIFDNDVFRTWLLKSINSNYIGYNYNEYRDNRINDFINTMSKNIDIHRIIDLMKK